MRDKKIYESQIKVFLTSTISKRTRIKGFITEFGNRL